MQLIYRQVSDEGLDEDSTLAWANPRRCGSHHRLSPGDSHSPGEEHRSLSNEPLQDAPVVEKLDD